MMTIGHILLLVLSSLLGFLASHFVRTVRDRALGASLYIVSFTVLMYAAVSLFFFADSEPLRIAVIAIAVCTWMMAIAWGSSRRVNAKGIRGVAIVSAVLFASWLMAYDGKFALDDFALLLSLMFWLFVESFSSRRGARRTGATQRQKMGRSNGDDLPTRRAG